MQDRDGENESEVEPVGDIDVRLGAPHNGAEIDQQIHDPHDGKPKIGIPFGLGVFLRLGNTEQIAGAGDHNKEIVAEHHEPRREIAHEPRPAGPLHHIERRADQHVAAKRKDDRRGVQGAQPAERDEGKVEVERREGELQRQPQPDRKAGDTPEYGQQGRELDRPHIVVRLSVDHQRHRRVAALEEPVGDGEDCSHACRSEEVGVKRVCGRVSLSGDDDRKNRQRGKGDCRTSFAQGHILCRCLRSRHKSSPASVYAPSARPICCSIASAKVLILMQIKDWSGRGARLHPGDCLTRRSSRSLGEVGTLSFGGPIKHASGRLFSAPNDFRYAMTSAIWPGSSLNSGIDGWPVMMPSASGSSRFSTG